MSPTEHLSLSVCKIMSPICWKFHKGCTLRNTDPPNCSKSAKIPAISWIPVGIVTKKGFTGSWILVDRRILNNAGG
ncbi:hypothetical protein P8452_37814 [Trifolium repens]|nr:hypothetical protein P8452_37814 [Trifolium repens]